MPQLEALYYPNFEPPEEWLRTFLLFHDRIRTIIPESIDNPFSPKILELTEYIPDAIEPIHPEKRDITLTDINMKRLEYAFKIFKEHQDKQGKSVEIKITPFGMEFGGGCILLHEDKVSDDVFNLLQKYDLLGPDFKKDFENHGITIENIDDVIWVNSESGYLILSLVADKIGKRYGWNTITDRKIDFTVNSLNSFKFSRIENPKTQLMTSIIQCEIPSEISELKLEEYKDIRDNYSSIRKSFQETVFELSNLYNLDQIEDQEERSRRIKEITDDFDDKIRQFKKTQTGQRIKKWTRISVTGMTAVVIPMMNDPLLSTGAAAISVICNVIPEIYPERQDSDTKVIRLFGELKESIVEPVQIRRLYSSAPPY